MWQGFDLIEIKIKGPPMLGIKDGKTVDKLSACVAASKIHGVSTIKLNNIRTRSGLMNEVFRSDWFEVIDVKQINFVDLKPHSSTDWHCHSIQTDRIIGLSAEIRLHLYDGRKESPSSGISEIFVLGISQPMMVIFPPGIWHKLTNENEACGAYLNVLEQLYDHQNPDDRRLPADTTEIPLAS
jgi:dTDP-4-dehydrorhamnose 3,5-epimerase